MHAKHCYRRSSQSYMLCLSYVSGNSVVYKRATLKVCGELIKYYIDNGIGHISIFLLIVFKGINSY